jgi:diamine N-acetyltransferase
MGEKMLQNEPLRLRPLEPEDLEVLYTIENDTTLWKVGCQNVPYSRYALHNYIAENKNDIYADKEVRFVIANTADGETIGLIDLFEFDPIHLRAQVGIVVRSIYRGKGWASRALEMLKDYARFLHIHQLYAYVDVANTESLQLFRKGGFTRESLLKDWLCTATGYENVLLLQCFL